MDCKLLICELMAELKSVKLRFLEEQLLWHGIDKNEIGRAVRILQERGIIYKKRCGTLELVDPATRNT